jgi:hypothetical protein
MRYFWPVSDPLQGQSRRSECTERRGCRRPFLNFEFLVQSWHPAKAGFKFRVRGFWLKRRSGEFDKIILYATMYAVGGRPVLRDQRSRAVALVQFIDNLKNCPLTVVSCQLSASGASAYRVTDGRCCGWSEDRHSRSPRFSVPLESGGGGSAVLAAQVVESPRSAKAVVGKRPKVRKSPLSSGLREGGGGPPEAASPKFKVQGSRFKVERQSGRKRTAGLFGPV